MSEHETGRLMGLLNELKRRHVFQVAAGYAAIAFVVLQVAEVTFEPLRLPSWAMPFLVVVALLGFPVTILLAWLFDVTPTGIHRTSAGRAGVGTAQRQFLAVTLIALLLTGGVGFGVTSRYLTDAPAQTAAVPVAENALAVLPFTNMAQPTDEYLSDGLTEDILTALANVGGLRVVSRTSVMQYRNTTKPIRQIAAELGVTHVLEGSVRRSGGELRVVAQLIDARTDAHVWAKTFDRSIDDIFQIQTEIAQEIATALAGELSRNEREQLARAPTKNLDAWKAYSQAREKLATRRTRELSGAIDLLQRAIRLDVGFALAHAELGQAFLQRAAATGQGEWRDSALVAVQHALDLDSALAEGHLVLGSYLLANGQLPQALEAFERAVQLKPNFAAAAAGIANVHATKGRYDEALEWAKRAEAVEPSGWNRLYVAHDYAYLGDFPRAREWAARALRTDPTFWAAHGFLAQLDVIEGQHARAAERIAAMLRAAGDEPLALAAAGELELKRGNLDAAKRYYEKLLAVAPESELEPTTPLGFIAWKAGDLENAAEQFRASATRVGQRFFESGGQAPQLYYEMAQIHAAQGDVAGAMRYLAEAVERGYRDYYQLSSDPLFESVRSEAGFKQTLAMLRTDVERMRSRVSAA